VCVYPSVPEFPRVSVKVAYQLSPHEEWPMSFQVGINCNDGVVLASDKKMTRMEGVRTAYQTRKIEIFAAENMAFCSTGDDFCVSFTKIVREENQKSLLAGKCFRDLKQALIDCVHAARQREAEHRDKRRGEIGKQPRELVGGSTLFVLREASKVQLWCVDTTAQFPNPFPVDDKMVVGDTTNAAVFFLNRYHAEIPSQVDAMLPLAVHTVRAAKNEFVDGVEAGVFTQSQFRTLNDKELQSAIDVSVSVDLSVGRAFGVRSK
jgi:hypothetical protein